MEKIYRKEDLINIILDNPEKIYCVIPEYEYLLDEESFNILHDKCPEFQKMANSDGTHLWELDEYRRKYSDLITDYKYLEEERDDLESEKSELEREIYEMERNYEDEIESLKKKDYDKNYLDRKWDEEVYKLLGNKHRLTLEEENIIFKITDKI